MICEALRGAERYVFVGHNKAAMGLRLFSSTSEYLSHLV